MENKYQSGKIYCIRNSIDDDIYIGSTCTPLSQRMVKHRSEAKRRPNVMPLYAKMNEHGIEHFYIELLEDCPCETKEQLNKREGELIRQLGGLNKRIAGRDHKEWYNDNLEHRKKYLEENRERLLQKHREYNEKHREEIRVKDKARYDANKKEIYERAKAWKTINHECPCGGSYNNSHKSTHMKSKRHQAYEASLLSD